MKFLKMLLFTLLVCIASYCHAQDTIVLNTNYVSICTVQKFNMNYMSIKVDSFTTKLKYADIKSIRLKNIARFEKIISLTPKAQPLIVYPINYKAQQEKLTLDQKKHFDSTGINPNQLTRNDLNTQILSSEYYLNRAGKKLVASGVCLILGSVLSTSTLFIPNNSNNASLRELILATASSLYLTSTITLISGGVNLKRAAKAKSARLSYRLSPTSGALCLSF